ncbi:hypothetical protein SPRG_04858 [Saprolegnia parasitica CBS 223.65]|uniref:Uncharacterized protein n=1 Tax=Saprolegnia parasitica (strain CBS 223.65) TaxID=695850 RepID=A0A067CT95_SAPPC|nr:hypothetical protein SPRG_04858 [Saprolegnia parasitica CBS 223.65]KDO29741.1 hypothetical protein SPRG_04858 [Saprolegnia parasitica CBS 223.65]|eukprot:XP_012199389.1 hypothetical protein SPRG_04858 [Saprolegnia parasitica CBS 223.65]
MDPKAHNTVLYVRAEDILDDTDAMPASVLDDIRCHTRFIWWSLLFLNGSCLWAYYSCLSAQTYYAARFVNTTLRFEYLTTPISTWPMFLGHLVQVLLGLDSKLGVLWRVRVGYTLYLLSAVAIVLQDVCNVSPEVGGRIVLVAFGTVGFANSLTEATFYALSALFPEAIFTNAMQLGNGTSGILNISLNTLIQLCVGGLDPPPTALHEIQQVSFYIFFSIFMLVCVLALVVYHELLRIPSLIYLVARTHATTAVRREALPATWARLWRITHVLWLPLVSQCLIFVVSLVSFPGIGISSGYQLANGASWANWYVNGVLLSYNYGDFAGRMVAPKLYPFFTLHSCFYWTIARSLLFLALLAGLPGSGRNPLFLLEEARALNVVWQLLVNLLLGLSTGVLSTITIGLGPRLLPQEDRESAGAVMCLGLLLGISSGASIGLEIGQRHWLGA